MGKLCSQVLDTCDSCRMATRTLVRVESTAQNSGLSEYKDQMSKADRQLYEKSWHGGLRKVG